MTRIQNVPKNLKMGLTAASDQYFPAPNYRTYYGNSTKPIVYFDSVTKSADALKKIEAEMKAVGNSIEKKNVELVKAKREYGEVCEGLIQFQNSIKHLRQSERKIQVELNHMKDIEDSTPVAITKVALEEEVSNLI